MKHPSSLDLESYACGEELGQAALDHIAACEACASFLTELRALTAAEPTEAEADAFVARAIAGQAASERQDEAAATTTHQAPLPAVSPPPAKEATRVDALVVPITQRQRPREADATADARRKRLWVLATSVVTPLAAAAAILVLARTSAGPHGADGQVRAEVVTTAPRTADTIQMGRLPPPVSTISQGDPETTFKGGTQIAVVRDRGGQQRRFSSIVQVKAGDRLRVEVALDHEQAILGAVLGDDGSYLELMPGGIRGAGTYFSERSARIDSSPTRGTIIIGTPEAVAVARATRRLDGVATLRVEWEAQP